MYLKAFYRRKLEMSYFKTHREYIKNVLIGRPWKISLIDNLTTMYSVKVPLAIKHELS